MTERIRHQLKATGRSRETYDITKVIGDMQAGDILVLERDKVLVDKIGRKYLTILVAVGKTVYRERLRLERTDDRVYLKACESETQPMSNRRYARAMESARIAGIFS